MNDFTELLNRIAATFPSRHALAKALDINASRLSRALNGTEKFSFNIENCLRLAKVSGEPASDVLRAAGKGEIADLIESLYGPGRKVTDSALQDLLKNWPSFSDDEKKVVRHNVAFWLGVHLGRFRSANAVGADAILLGENGAIAPLQLQSTDKTRSRDAPKERARKVKNHRAREESMETTALKKRGRST